MKIIYIFWFYIINKNKLKKFEYIKNLQNINL